jgi:hypothetical protein
MDKQKFMFYLKFLYLVIHTDFRRALFMAFTRKLSNRFKEHIELIVITCHITVLPVIYKFSKDLRFKNRVNSKHKKPSQ